MKIIIHSLDELLQLTALIRGGTSTTKVGAVEHTIKVDVSDFDAVKLAQEINDHCGTLRGEYEFEQACSRGLPTDIPAPLAAAMDAAVAETSAALRQEAEATGQLDADGVPHSTDWHSDPPKINADGRWKARRGRDNDAYKWWLQEQAVTAETAVAADAEPVATETHALPQDGPELHAADGEALSGPAVVAENEGLNTFAEMAAVAQPAVDLAALVDACRPLAGSQSADVRELLSAAQAFTTTHGHARFNELKSAVTPVDGNPFGKALQLFSPEERQLMRACIENYPKS